MANGVSGCGCEMEARNEQERKTLKIVLAINFAMFVIELVLGLIAQSSGLITDSLDMLADATVYAIGLYAVGRSQSIQNNLVRYSGFILILLAVFALSDVIRRFIYPSEPVSILMISVGLIALIANLTSLTLINKHRHDGVHMRASWIFTRVDVIANAGVIVAGILVLVFGSRFPDLIIGSIIALVVLFGGIKILQEARSNS